MARHRAQARASRPAARAPKEVVEKARGADGAAAPPVALAEAARAASAKGQRKEIKKGGKEDAEMTKEQLLAKIAGLTTNGDEELEEEEERE